MKELKPLEEKFNYLHEGVNIELPINYKTNLDPLDQFEELYENNRRSIIMFMYLKYCNLNPIA